MTQITAGQSVKRDFKLNREQLEQTVFLKRSFTTYRSINSASPPPAADFDAMLIV